MSHQRTTIGALTIALSLASFFTTAQAQDERPQKRIQPPSPDSPQRDGQTPKQKLKQIRTQLQSVDRTLNKAQEAAMEKKEVQQKQKTYLDEQKKQMLAIAPNQEKAINRRFELFEELARDQRGNEQEEQELAPKERQDKVKEFQQLNQSLRSTQKKADAKEAVSEKLEAYQEGLIEAMKEENEDVEQLLQKRQKLIAQYRQLRLQMQNLLQKRQQGQGNPNPRPQK